MIHWLWLIPAAMIGATVGIAFMSCAIIGKLSEGEIREGLS